MIKQCKYANTLKPIYEIGGEQSHYYKMRYYLITRKREKGNVQGVKVACSYSETQLFFAKFFVQKKKMEKIS